MEKLKRGVQWSRFRILIPVPSSRSRRPECARDETKARCIETDRGRHDVDINCDASRTEREKEREAKARSFRWLLLIPTTSMSPVIDSDKYNRTARVIGIIDVEWKRVEQKRSCNDQPIHPYIPLKKQILAETTYDLWSSNYSDQSAFFRDRMFDAIK